MFYIFVLAVLLVINIASNIYVAINYEFNEMVQDFVINQQGKFSRFLCNTYYALSWIVKILFMDKKEAQKYGR